MEYYKEHGSCNVPRSHVYECDLTGLIDAETIYHYKDNLGRWLDRQRAAKADDTLTKITQDQVDILQTLVDEGEYCGCCCCSVAIFFYLDR